MAANPDFATVWNYRREILVKLIDDIENAPKETRQREEDLTLVEQSVPSSNDNSQQSIPSTSCENIAEAEHEVPQIADASQRIDELLEGELDLTVAGLHKNPKSYCVWHQRQWIITKMKNPNLKREIALCGQMLALDERNCE